MRAKTALMTAFDVAILASELVSLASTQVIVPVERSNARCRNFAGDSQYRVVRTSCLVKIWRNCRRKADFLNANGNQNVSEEWWSASI